MLSLLKTHQQTVTLVIGYLLVAGLSFGLGRISAASQTAPEIKVEEAFLPPNYTTAGDANQGQNASNNGGVPGKNPDTTGPTDCKPGQIKGNIGSGSRVYHMPGGSFYNRTKAEACFDTEAEAKAAGFRKSNS